MAAARRHVLILQHLGDEEIIAYLDGELPRHELERTRTHLESCWSCRSRMGEIQSNIDNFVCARKALLPDQPEFSEAQVEQFRQRLAAHAKIQDSVSRFWPEQMSSWGARIRGTAVVLLPYRNVAVATVVALCLLVVLLTNVWNTRVSADTVLLRAENYEANHLPKSGQVTTTSVRVDRSDGRSHAIKQLGTIILVRDSLSNAIYVKAESSSGTYENTLAKDMGQFSEPLLHHVFADGEGDPALLQYLVAQQWIPDLSIARFRRLVESRGSSIVDARRDKAVFELHYPFSAGQASGVVEALLRVDASDYAPTSLSIFTTGRGGNNEYRFTRTSFSYGARTPELARMFLRDESSKPGASSVPSLAQADRPVPLSYANSNATEGEVSIATALHKIDACLGEEIYVIPMSDGSLLVQGLVDSPARRQVIAQALKPLGGSLHVQVYIPRELKNGSELYQPPDQFVPDLAAGDSSSATPADSSRSTAPLHEMLYRHFDKPGASPEDTNKQVASFSDEIVTLARQTFLHAWALKRLEREFAARRVSGLPPLALQKIEQMREDHLHWISTITKQEAGMLALITSPEGASSIAEVAGGHDSETLLRLAQEQNDLVHSLFTTSTETQAPEMALGRLMAVLKHLST